MATTSCGENDARHVASLSRHILDEENDAENDAYKDRLARALGKESARSFALRAGISPTGIRQHLKGESLPTLDTLLATAKAANVNVLWLATGEGPMRGESMPCHGHVDEKLLREALALVEEVGTGRPIDRKVAVTAAVYERYSAGEPLGSETVRRLVETLI